MYDTVLGGERLNEEVNKKWHTNRDDRSSWCQMDNRQAPCRSTDSLLNCNRENNELHAQFNNKRYWLMPSLHSLYESLHKAMETSMACQIQNH